MSETSRTPTVAQQSTDDKMRQADKAVGQLTSKKDDHDVVEQQSVEHHTDVDKDMQAAQKIRAAIEDIHQTARAMTSSDHLAHLLSVFGSVHTQLVNLEMHLHELAQKRKAAATQSEQHQ